MTHLDVERAATHAFVGSVDELGHRLGPSYPFDYCEACDVPDLAVPDSFFDKVAGARTALLADDHVEAVRKAAEAIEILRVGLRAEATTEERVELLLQRLLLPALVDLLPDGGVAQSIVVGLMMLDRRIAEWYPDTFAGNRLTTLFWQVVNRWREESDGGGAGDSWPFYLVDVTGLAATVLTPLGWLDNDRVQLWGGYGWDAPDGFGDSNARTAAERTFSAWYELHDDLPVEPGSYAPTPPAHLDFSFGVTLVPLSRDLGGPAVLPFATGDLGSGLDLPGDWTMAIGAGGGTAGGAGAQALAAGGSGSGGLLDLRVASGGKEPALSWGDARTPDEGRALVLEKIVVEASLVGDMQEFDADETDARVVLRIEKGKFFFGPPENAFLNRLVPHGISGTFTVAFTASVRDGFSWEGGLGTEIFTAVDWRTPKVAGIRLEVPHLRMKLAFEQPAPAAEDEEAEEPADTEETEEADVRTGASLSLEAGLGLRLTLGPITFGLGDLGGRLALAHALDSDGSVGPLDLTWELTDPRSVSFALAVGSAKGEGFLARDPAQDRWTGAWRLKFGRFQLDGIVIAEQGSVLAVAWMTNLGLPMPAGTLDGVGVLVGTDRRGDPDAFLAGLKTGVLDAVLFPADPVGQAPQLVATLTQLFPREEDRLVLGILLQWHFGGEARIITAELGVVLEWGPGGFGDVDHVYVLGQGDVRIPRLPDSVFRLHVELFGHYDVEAGSFLLRVELRDSRLARGELTGGGLVAVDDREDEEVVVTFGGFNPRYPVPPRLAGVPRLAAHLADRPNFMLYFEFYVAVTSTSFQLGGKLALRAELKGFVVEGWLVLDVLYRSDGEFFVDVAFYIGLKRGGKTLASLEVAGTLAGMATWSLTGRATLKILFFKVSIPIEWTSSGGTEPDPAAVDAEAAAISALTAPESWMQDGRAGAVALVDTVRDGIWLRPEQGVEVRQSVLPLGESLTRLGGSPLLGAQRVDLTDVRFAGTPVPQRPTVGRFNMALYRDVDLEEAVRAPFAEDLPAGVAVDLDTVVLGEAVPGPAAHEDIVIDDRHVPAAAVVAAADDGGRLAAPVEPPPTVPEAPVVESEAAAYEAPRDLFGLVPPRYVVTDTHMRVRWGDARDGAPFTAARDRVREAHDETLRWYVVRQHEVVA